MLSLYIKLISARIRSQMQYKVSFWLELIGFAFTTALEFAIIAILFSQFPSVAGWNVAEVAVLYGLSSTALGLAEMFGRGFDAPFERMIQRGEFDVVLIRPQGSFFQILSSEFQLRRLGRSFQGIVVLGFALSHLSIDWTIATVFLLPLTIIAGSLIYLGLMVMGATLCFWTIKTPEVMNIFTFGGDLLMSYPVSIYSQWIRGFFLFIIPLVFVNYPAALVVLNKPDPHGLAPELAWIAPVIAIMFLSVARVFWSMGVSKYTSSL